MYFDFFKPQNFVQYIKEKLYAFPFVLFCKFSLETQSQYFLEYLQSLYIFGLMLGQNFPIILCKGGTERPAYPSKEK